MTKNRYSYVAVFDYNEDGISIEFPDLEDVVPALKKTTLRKR